MQDNRTQQQNRAQIKEDLQRAQLFESMIKTQAWSEFEKLLNHHIAQRSGNLFGPTKAGEEYIEQHNKGTICGLMLARDIPRATVNSMRQFRDSFADLPTEGAPQ